MKKTILLLILMPFFTYGQYQAGLRTDNYNLLNSQQINPAAFVSYQGKWSLNIIEADLFASNNYAFLMNTGLTKLNDPNAIFVQIGDTEDSNFSNPDKIEYDVVDSKRNLFTFANVNIMGPSFGIKLGDNFYASFAERFRSHTNAKGIDNILSYNTYDNYPLLTDGTVDPFHFAHLTWSSFDFTLGYQGDFVGEKAAIAITLKYLRPYESLYFNSQDQLTFNKYSGDSILVDASNFDIAFSPIFYDDQFENGDIQSNGTGFGIDIGFNTLIGGDEEDYVLKLGASITDLGRVKFDDSRFYTFNSDNSFEFLTNAYKDAEDVQDLVSIFSDQTLSNPILVEQTKALTMWTPAKFGIQADYRIKNDFFVNFNYTKSFPFQSNGLEAPDLINLTPRYERKWFSAALPISILQYQHILLGTSVRLGPLVIGSDNVLSLFKKRKVYGTDLYIALVLNPFKVSSGGGKNRYSKRGSKNKAKCYEF